MEEMSDGIEYEYSTLYSRIGRCVFNMSCRYLTGSIVIAFLTMYITVISGSLYRCD